jgi:isoquinoline 1-oxidoreductase subunit alpha
LIKKINMPVYTLSINNKPTKITAEADMPLVWAIRDFAGLKGTKFGCGIAQCGACTVHIDGQPVRSCQMPLSAISKKAKITTVEGISEKTLHAVQKAWIEEQVPQCGYCQSGQIMTAVALLNTNKKPTDSDISAAMEGNLCRCGTYQRINNAIKNASKAL